MRSLHQPLLLGFGDTRFIERIANVIGYIIPILFGLVADLRKRDGIKINLFMIDMLPQVGMGRLQSDGRP